jgi:hypothetical protein
LQFSSASLCFFSKISSASSLSCASTLLPYLQRLSSVVNVLILYFMCVVNEQIQICSFVVNTESGKYKALTINGGILFVVSRLMYGIISGETLITTLLHCAYRVKPRYAAVGLYFVMLWMSAPLFAGVATVETVSCATVKPTRMRTIKRYFISAPLSL